MGNIQNKNKIYVVSVICLGVIISIWLLQRPSGTKPITKNDENGVSVNPYRNIERNDDWKKILVSVDNSAIDTTLISKSNTSANTDDDSTLTDQMSRDFLAQYLLAVKNNGSVDSSDANIIAQNTLSMPDYTKSAGATYISTNLKIGSKNDAQALRIYRNRLFKILYDRSSRIKDDPVVIFLNAMNTESERDLSKLDYIISQNKGFLNDLLILEVPRSAVSIHLSLLNSASGILANLEAMRLVLGDPVKGLAGIGEYYKNLNAFQSSLQNINNFFTENL